MQNAQPPVDSLANDICEASAAAQVTMYLHGFSAPVRKRPRGLAAEDDGSKTPPGCQFLVYISTSLSSTSSFLLYFSLYLVSFEQPPRINAALNPPVCQAGAEDLLTFLSIRLLLSR
jgi:hypothetical protein